MSISLAHFTGTIAVSGLKTGDNPQPGVPVIRSIRNAGFTGRIIGLIYDSLESGIYLDGLVDDVYQMPYPSEGAETFMMRLEYILSQTPIDVIIPTLDSEILTYLRLQGELQYHGIHTFLPEEDQFILRDKTKLSTFFPPLGINTPKTIVMTDPSMAYQLDDTMPLPLMVKGRFYDAFQANTIEEVIKHYHHIVYKWGHPVLLQRMVTGNEFNVVMIGDGEGNVIGMVPQRKLIITDKGKGFSGVVVHNEGLDAFSRKIVELLHWRGPCELEIMKGFDNEYYLLEINPRFPAWVRLAEGAGQNLPAAVVALALGEQVTPFARYDTGTLFVRHAEDIISHISVMGKVSTTGELRKTTE